MKKMKPGPSFHPSIVNDQLVLAMALLLLVMAGMLAGVQGTARTNTQTQAAGVYPTQPGR